MSASVQIFGAAHAALDVEIDWEELGRAYCDGDGSTFFDAKLRARMLDTGLWIADDLARRFSAHGPRRSVYVGAAVAELAPILCEHLVLGREVIWLNLDSIETRELTRAIQVVASRLGIELPRPSTAALESVAKASCDHVWMVSVLTDPDAFPALHDELYARKGSDLATGRGQLSGERQRAEQLTRALLACAAPTSTLCTSDEELELLRPLARALGMRLDVSLESRTSAVVGDRIRICELRAGSPALQTPAPEG